MKIKTALSILIILSIGCSKQSQINIFEITSIEKESSKKYFFLIEPFKKENEIIEAKLLDEWKSEDGLLELIDASIKEKEHTSIEEYKYKTKSESIILIKESNVRFEIGEQIIVEIIQDVDSKFKIISEKIINLKSIFREPIIQKQEERMLTSNGKIVNLEYQFVGKFECNKSDLISLIKNSNFSGETIAKKMKSLLRKEIGALLNKEVTATIEDDTFKKEIKNQFKAECFKLDEFEIKIK